MANPKSIGKRNAYNQAYRKTPNGAAACAWNRLTSRSGAKYGHRECYASIEVRCTREEFMLWAVPAYEAWLRDRPGVTPSVDRIDSTKHYEVGNLQLLPLQENRSKNSRHRNLFAPDGQHWCSKCQAYRPSPDFYQNKSWVTKNNPLGLAMYCKPCTRAYARDRASK